MKTLKANYMLIPLLCAASLAHADPLESLDFQALLTVGAMGAMSSQIGTNTSFPIVDPVTDSFYDYVDTSTSQTLWGFNIFAGIEWPINSLISIQAGLDYVRTSQINIDGTLTQGADAQSADHYQYHYNIIAQQALLEGKLLFNVKQIYHPYLLLGLGAAFNQSRDFDIDNPECLSVTREYENKVSTNFSYALGLGIDFDLISQLRAGFSYRYTGLGDAELGDASVAGTPVEGSLSTGAIGFNELLFQLTWLF